MTERKKLEGELKVTLTKMVENSRKTLKCELKLAILDGKVEDGGKVEIIDAKNEELITQINNDIDEDCDSKLLMIPDVIKAMLDKADSNADKISNGVLVKNGVLG